MPATATAEPLPARSNAVRALTSSSSPAASGSIDRTIRLWNVTDAKEVHKLDGHSADIYSLCFSPDGKRLASVDYAGNLFLWDVDGARPILQQKIAPGVQTYGVSWSPDGRRLAIAASDKRGLIFDVP